MLKKLMISAMLLIVGACSVSDEKNAPVPAEYAGADYLLSDKDAQNWVMQARQTEQCIYPNLTRIQQDAFKKEDTFVYSQYVFFYPLEDIVGANILNIIKNDQKSMDFATYQYKKFRDLKTLKVEEMDDAQCEVLRRKARDDLAVVKGEYRSAMIEETKEEKVSGTNLEKSRFSFDILKWGVALML